MGNVDSSDVQVRSIVDDDRAAHSYLLFANGQLLRADEGSSTHAYVIAELPNIDQSGGEVREIKMYAHGNWVCVTERYGLNAALVNLDTGHVRELSREDYCSECSSYSAGFLEEPGTRRTLLITQTEWNRLDILDAATGERLTQRPASDSEDGSEEFDYEQDLDYFHSLLHVSPDSRHFLDNGWIWQPWGVALLFSADKFRQGWEHTAMMCEPGTNWDRPATFLGNDRFVLSMDYRPGTEQHELGIFAVPDFRKVPNFLDDEGPENLPELIGYIDCDVFPRDGDGSVWGELHYDPVRDCLIAMTETNGTLALSLTGEILAHMREIVIPERPSMWNHPDRALGWAYSSKHRVFYKYDDEGIAERVLPLGS